MPVTIPNCYDSITQEEQRQAEWDEYVEKLPACTLCRRNLFPGQKFHTAGHLIVCASCVEELNENIETVEDPE